MTRADRLRLLRANLSVAREDGVVWTADLKWLLSQLARAEAVVEAARTVEAVLPDYLSKGAEEVDALMDALIDYDAEDGQ